MQTLLVVMFAGCESSLRGPSGLIPEPPTEAEGAPLKVEYISLLAQAQKAVGTQSITAAASFVGNLAQFNPDVLD